VDATPNGFFYLFIILSVFIFIGAFAPSAFCLRAFRKLSVVEVSRFRGFFYTSALAKKSLFSDVASFFIAFGFSGSASG